MANFRGARTGLEGIFRANLPSPPPWRSAFGARRPRRGPGPPLDSVASRLDANRSGADNPRMPPSLLDQLVQAFGGARRHAETGTGAGREAALAAGSPGGVEEPEVRQLLDALRALGLEPRAFFDLLYGREEHAPFHAPLAEVYREKLRSVGLAFPPPPPEAPEGADLSPTRSDDELRRRIDDRLAEAFFEVTAG